MIGFWIKYECVLGDINLSCLLSCPVIDRTAIAKYCTVVGAGAGVPITIVAIGLELIPLETNQCQKNYLNNLKMKEVQYQQLNMDFGNLGMKSANHRNLN